MIATTTAIGFGAVIAGVVAGWAQVKSYLLQIYGIFMYNASVDSSIAENLNKYLNEKKFLRFAGSHFYWESWEPVKGKKERIRILMEAFIPENGCVFFMKYGFLSFKWSSNNGAVITAPRTIDVKKLLIESTGYMPSVNTSGGFYVERVTGKRFSRGGVYSEDAEQIAPSKTSGAPSGSNIFLSNASTSSYISISKDMVGVTEKSYLDNLYLSNDMKDAVVDARRWYNSKEWYLDHFVSWRRGWLFYGKPGCGKTRFAVAIAQDLKIPLISFDIASMTNSDFIERFDRGANYPRVILIEDIDGVFDKRVNITNTDMNPGMTFDCLLNTMDGVDSKSGTLIIITTNNIEKVDPALAGIANGDGSSTRPGRIDRVFEFVDLDQDGREWMANKILGDFDRSLWGDIMSHQHSTGAQFQEYCCRKAMDLFWRKK